MKYFIKKIYLIIFFLLIVFFNSTTNASDEKLKYSREDVSNYFLGIVNLNKNNTTSGFKYLDRAQSLSNIHSNYISKCSWVDIKSFNLQFGISQFSMLILTIFGKFAS